MGRVGACPGNRPLRRERELTCRDPLPLSNELFNRDGHGLGESWGGGACSFTRYSWDGPPRQPISCRHSSCRGVCLPAPPFILPGLPSRGAVSSDLWVHITWRTIAPPWEWGGLWNCSGIWSTSSAGLEAAFRGDRKGSTFYIPQSLPEG